MTGNSVVSVHAQYKFGQNTDKCSPVAEACGSVELIGWCIMGLVSKAQNDWRDVARISDVRVVSVRQRLGLHKHVNQSREPVTVKS